MKVLIDKRQKLYLESDGTQFILKKYTGKQDNKGSDIFTTLGYFGSIDQAIKMIYHTKIHQSNATNLKELLEDHKRIIKEVKELWSLEGVK